MKKNLSASSLSKILLCEYRQFLKRNNFVLIRGILRGLPGIPEFWLCRLDRVGHRLATVTPSKSHLSGLCILTLHPFEPFKLLVFSFSSPVSPQVLLFLLQRRLSFLRVSFLLALTQQHFFLLLSTLESMFWKNLNRIQPLGISADCLRCAMIFTSWFLQLYVLYPSSKEALCYCLNCRLNSKHRTER